MIGQAQREKSAHPIEETDTCLNSAHPSDPLPDEAEQISRLGLGGPPLIKGLEFRL